MYFSGKEKRETDGKRTGCGILAKTGRECGIRTPPPLLQTLNKEIERFNSDLSSQSLSLEYMDNQSGRNNIRVNGILESSRKTWEEAEEKVKDAVKTKLGIDIDIERAH